MGRAFLPPRFLVAKGNKDVSRWRVSEYLKRKFDGRVNYPGRRFSCYQGKHGRDDYFALSRTARTRVWLHGVMDASRVMDCDIIDTVFY